MRKIALFILCAMLAYAFPAYSFPTFSIDTLVITNKKGDVVHSKDVANVMQSDDKRAIADMFYNTGYVLVNSYNNNNDSLQKAFVYFDYAIAYYDSADALHEKALCIEHQATLSYLRGQQHKAIQLFQKAIKEYESLQVPDYSQIAGLNTNIAFIFFNSYRYMQARHFFSAALEEYKKMKDTEKKAECLYYIGLTFFETEVYDSAYVYYMKALEYDKITNNKNEIVASYNNICVVLLHQKQFDKAFDFLSQVDSLTDSISDRKVKAIHLNNKGNARFYAGQYDAALNLYHQSLSIKQEIEDTTGQAISFHNIARIYLLQNDVIVSEEYIKQALDLSQKYAQKNVYADVCRTASDIYDAKGNEKLALHYFEEFVTYSFSVLSQDVSQITESHVKYQENRVEAASLEREIKMQKLLADYDFAIKQTEIQTVEEQRKAQKMMIYAIIAGIIFIVGAVLLIYNRYRIKKRATSQLEQHNIEIEKQNAIIEEQSQTLIASNQEFEKLSIVASNTDNAIIIMDNAGNLEWINDAFIRMFGYNLEEFRQRVSPNIISDSTPQYIQDAFAQCVSSKTTVNYDLQTTTKADDEIWVNVTLTPIFDDFGNISRLVMIDADITDLKRAESEIKKQKNYIEQQKEEFTQHRDEVIEQSKELEAKKDELSLTLEKLQSAQNKLVESEKMAALGSLVAGISHEINTPVGIGSAAATTLLTRTQEIFDLFSTKKMKLSDLKAFIEAAEQACDLIRKNLTRTADLIKSFNKVSVDNMSEEKREFNLCEYIDDIARSLSPKFKGRKIALLIDCPESISIVSYPGAFAQIFTNFIINSLVHAFGEDEEGQIHISVSEEQDALKCVYSDNGCGIPKENQEKVFEAFFTTNTEVGTGLGMSISYNLIIQKLGGSIVLDSEEGNGVTFTILIPLEQLKA